MPQPDFLIIGAQKAGTSWLAHNLAQHPSVYLPPDELHFFDKSARFARGLFWYEAQFAPPPGAACIGEKTPDYLWSDEGGAEDHTPGVAERIHAAYPDLRLICVLRDPVARAVSAARHLLQTGRVRPSTPLDALLVGDAMALAKPHGVLAQGFYARNLRRYLGLFGAERMCVLFYEDDLRDDPLGTLQRVCRFLGVATDVDFPDHSQRINDLGFSRRALVLSYALPWLGRPIRAIDRRLAKSYRPEASAHTLAALARLYAPANAELFALLGRSAPHWRMA
ncbi:MAG: sulfotransferase family protein [Pseudomonadota bacterium]